MWRRRRFGQVIRQAQAARYLGIGDEATHQTLSSLGW
jgi:hypothetical protein